MAITYFIHRNMGWRTISDMYIRVLKTGWMLGYSPTHVLHSIIARFVNMPYQSHYILHYRVSYVCHTFVLGNQYISDCPLRAIKPYDILYLWSKHRNTIKTVSILVAVFSSASYSYPQSWDIRKISRFS